MKKNLLVLFALIFFTCISCQKKIDVTKEEAAIKATFEEEKAAFFKQDYVGIGETWVKEPLSIKIFMSDKGQTKFDGWENINASIQKETKDDSWDRKLVKATFSNYQIDVMDKSAWVMCETNWEGIFRGDTINAKQTRINVLKKVDGKWKFALMAIYNLPKKSE